MNAQGGHTGEARRGLGQRRPSPKLMMHIAYSSYLPKIINSPISAKFMFAPLFLCTYTYALCFKRSLPDAPGLGIIVIILSDQNPTHPLLHGLCARRCPLSNVPSLPLYVSFQTIRTGSGILGFRPCWCTSPFPLLSIYLGVF